LALAFARGMLPRYGKPLNPPYKEKLPEIRSLGRHPWELTLREFIEQVRRDYGIEIEITEAAIAGGRFLSKNGRLFPVPVMDLDALMPLPLLRFLCELYQIPPEDFRLDPRDDW
jgi:hypothetical protein